MPIKFPVSVSTTHGDESSEYLINVWLYQDVDEIIGAYLETDDAQAQFTTVTIFGERSMNREEAREFIQGMGSWGWCCPEDPEKVVHIWVDNNADPEKIRLSLLVTLAHEQGHLCSPHFRDLMHEERKAGRYEDVAMAAAMATDVIIDGVQYQALRKFSDRTLMEAYQSYSSLMTDSFISGGEFRYGSVCQAIIREMRRRTDEA